MSSMASRDRIQYMLCKKLTGTTEMAPQAEVLATKPDDQSSVPRTHIKEQTDSHKLASDSIHTLWHTHRRMHMNTHTHTHAYAYSMLAHAHTNVRAHTCIHIHTYMHTYMHRNAYNYIYTHMLTHTNKM